MLQCCSEVGFDSACHWQLLVVVGGNFKLPRDKLSRWDNWGRCEHAYVASTVPACDQANGLVASLICMQLISESSTFKG
jgi:hypothetical protein